MRNPVDDSDSPVLIGPSKFITFLSIAAVTFVLLICLYFAFIVYSIGTEETGWLPQLLLSLI